MPGILGRLTLFLRRRLAGWRGGAKPRAASAASATPAASKPAPGKRREAAKRARKAARQTRRASR